MSQLLYAHVLLDRSSSMEVIRDKTIDAVNEYAASLAADATVDTAVSLSLFDTFLQGMALDVVVDGRPVKDWTPLTRASYAPRGSTPLNDAIIATIERMEGEWHRPGERISLAIMTDGQENSSRATNADVKGAIERIKNRGWLVIFLGANIDSFAVAGSYGINVANTMDWATQNVGNTMQSASRSQRMYASGATAQQAGFTSAERARAMAPEDPSQGLSNDLLEQFSQQAGGQTTSADLLKKAGRQRAN